MSEKAELVVDHITCPACLGTGTCKWGGCHGTGNVKALAIELDGKRYNWPSEPNGVLIEKLELSWNDDDTI